MADPALRRIQQRVTAVPPVLRVVLGFLVSVLLLGPYVMTGPPKRQVLLFLLVAVPFSLGLYRLPWERGGNRCQGNERQRGAADGGE